MLSENSFNFRAEWNVVSLNPCFNGICSLRAEMLVGIIDELYVLILVLMEYAL